MGDRFVHSSLLQKSDAKAVVGDEVVCGAGERVGPQGFAVFPIRGLFPGADHQHCEHGGHQTPKGRAARMPFRAPLRRQPRHRHINPNLRQVGVAIGMGLVAHLDDSHHRQQHHQIPEPSHQQPRLLPPLPHMRLRKAGQQRPGQRHFPCRQAVVRIGIKHRQSRRLDHLAKINHAGHQRVAQAQRQRK